MKARLIGVLLGSLIATGVFAQTKLDAKAEELMKKSGCLACHSVDAKLVGPGYRDVAKKYKTDKSAEAKLVAKVKAGGSGVWGTIPMPPNAAVKEDDIKTIVHSILAL